jgi:putative transposase
LTSRHYLVFRVARRLRIQFSGALYHVINRGNYRRDVFGSVGAAQAFESTIAEACDRYRWRLHAFGIMPNHYHLALETPDPNLVEGMHWLQSTFATRFNRFRDERGHLFQGRFQSPLVEDARALVRVINYIHLNPVRAHMVPAADCGSFRWSSLRRLMQADRPKWLFGEALLGQLELPDSREGWASYSRHLAALAALSAGQEAKEFTELCTGWAIGTEGWKRAVAKEHRQLALHPGYEASELRDLKERGWREQLERKLLNAGKTMQDVPFDPANAAWKIDVAVGLRRECIPYAWIRDALAMRGLSSIRGLVFRREHRTAPFF